MNSKTFKACFCVKDNTTPEEFSRIVLNRSLYPHARFLKWLLFFYDPAYFDADTDLIADAGSLSRNRDFSEASDRFNIHLGNRGFLRRKCHLRVSTTRLRALLKETLGHHTARTAQRERGFAVLPFRKPALD